MITLIMSVTTAVSTSEEESKASPAIASEWEKYANTNFTAARSAFPARAKIPAARI